MSDRFAPIPVGKVLPPPRFIPAPMPQPLESSRARPDFDAMDDCAEYAQGLLHDVTAEGVAA